MGKYEMSVGPKQKAVKFCIYGCEGVGKSTLASKLPNVVFIDTEGSTDTMDVVRFPTPRSFTELMDMVDATKDLTAQTKAKTLVIDTLDWTDNLCAKSLCDKKQWTSIEDAGYGKGYVMLGEEFGKLLNKLNELNELGINVGFTAHAQLRKIEKPEETGAYDHWEMKCSKKVAPLVREWCDLMLFCNYDSVVIHGNNAMEKNKITGNKRVMYANHQATFDAKNRFGLPDKMPLDYEYIRGVFEKTPAAAPAAAPKTAAPAPQRKPAAAPAEKPKEAPIKAPETLADLAELSDSFKAAKDPLETLEKKFPALVSLMRADNISYAQVQSVVGEKGYYTADTPIEFYDPDFVSGCLVACWKQIDFLPF